MYFSLQDDFLCNGSACFLLKDLQLHEVVGLRVFPADNLALLEPQSNLLLGVLDGVRAVADVATLVESIVTADGARG